ncbi:MAG: PorV/PorQ family protein, partial [bacterium]
GGQAGAFLRVGVGARAMGMGSAFTATANDASAIYWNPAGLGGLQSIEFVGAYSILSLDRGYNFLAACLPTNSIGTIGISWINFGVGGIEGRDLYGRVTDTFTNSENAFLFSWGKELSEQWFLGLTAKYLSHSLQSNASTGFGFDAGLLFRPSEVFSMGITLQDIASQVTWDTESSVKEKFPMVSRIGIAVSPADLPFRVGLDYVQVQNQTGGINVGAEFQLIQNGGLRVGFNNGSIGAGGFFTLPVEDYNLGVNYTFGQDPVDQSWSHRFSLVFTLEGKKLNLSPPRNQQMRSAQEPKQEFSYSKKKQDNNLNLDYSSPVARVIKVSTRYPDYAIINAGLKYGIQTGLKLGIYRIGQLNDIGNEDQVKIGEVEVVKVKDDFSAIRVIDIEEGLHIENGDVLMELKSDQISNNLGG